MGRFGCALSPLELDFLPIASPDAICRRIHPASGRYAAASNQQISEPQQQRQPLRVFGQTPIALISHNGWLGCDVCACKLLIPRSWLGFAGGKGMVAGSGQSHLKFTQAAGRLEPCPGGNPCPSQHV